MFSGECDGRCKPCRDRLGRLRPYERSGSSDGPLQIEFYSKFYSCKFHFIYRNFVFTYLLVVGPSGTVQCSMIVYR